MFRHLLLTSTATAVAGSLLAAAAGAQTAVAPGEVTRTAAADDIVVTAQKRGAETLLKTPVPVAVLDTVQLAQREQVKLQDYASEVPGFTVAPAAANQSTLSIRGINAGGQGGGPTVGLTLDDVPFVSSAYQPELDPGDLERIEVLRGPQGTLYGTNAMGGLIRFVTKDPSTEAASGQITGGVSGVAHGNAAGFSFRASVNVPLSDKLAIRVSGFRRQEPGYISNVLTQEQAINKANAEGARGAILFKPSSAFSVELTALAQTIRNDASDEIVPATGQYSTNAPKGQTSSSLTVRSFSALVKGKIGGIALTSITGYNTLDNLSRTDFSYAFGNMLKARFGVAPYATVLTPGNLTAFTEELRFDTTIAGRLDIQVAGFYLGGRNDGGLTITPPDPLTGRLVLPLDAFNTFASVTHRHEYAGFGALTYHFTDRLQLEAGVRESYLEQTTDPYFRFGNFNRPNPLLVAATRSTASPFTYLVTPSFQVTPDVLLYARAASGYRQGGSNTTPGAPEQFAPDKTYNYEAGVKGKFLNRKLTADLSVYYIDWNNIQLQLRTPLLLVYTGNGGQAKSDGVEFTLTARPTATTTITGWADYDEAVLTADFVNSPTYGKKGDRLPNTPRFSAHLAVRQEVPLGRDIDGFVEAEANYVGERLGIFQATAVRQVYPTYTQVNLRTGINFNNYAASIYVNNVGDVYGQLNGGLGFSNPFSFIYIRPRTFGGTVTAKF